jgi:hypothetical protein
MIKRLGLLFMATTNLYASEFVRKEVRQRRRPLSSQCYTAITQLTRYTQGADLQLDDFINTFVKILSQRELAILATGFEENFLSFSQTQTTDLKIQRTLEVYARIAAEFAMATTEKV